MTTQVINLATLTAVIVLTACADALVYGERTSLNLASVRLNDDPSQPVAVKLGFDRDVVLVAPALGGDVVDVDDQGRQRTTPSGEAVSQFSTFTVSTKAPFLPDGQVNQVVSGEQTDQEAERADLLGVRTRFASGEAARKIAGAPEVVAAFLGLSPVSQAVLDNIPRSDEIIKKINTLSDDEVIDLVRMPPGGMNDAMRNTLETLDPQGLSTRNANAARGILLEWFPFDVDVATYPDWERALGLMP